MNWALTGLFFIQIIGLFFISRLSIRYIFYLLHSLTSSQNTVYFVIAALFIPGTIVHELSHFLMAIALMLKVREIHIFPQWETGYIKLGRVIYEKKDVLRSILVGIAPIIIGLLFFWWLSALNLLETQNLLLKCVVIYIIFVISSTMFSSKQDLVDLIYIIPIFLIIAIILYFFPIDFSIISRQTILIDGTHKFLYDVNKYLFISLLIHIVLISILYVLLKLFKK